MQVVSIVSAPVHDAAKMNPGCVRGGGGKITCVLFPGRLQRSRCALEFFELGLEPKGVGLRLFDGFLHLSVRPFVLCEHLFIEILFQSVIALKERTFGGSQQTRLEISYGCQEVTRRCVRAQVRGCGRMGREDLL